MTRDLSSSQKTEATSTSAAAVHLLELVYFDDGTSSESEVHFTTASQDITATIDGGDITFSGVGGFLEWSGVSEDTDDSAQGVDLKLDGVDQTVISAILNNQFRGRPVRIWRAWLEPSGGNIVDSPLLIFRGKQLGSYDVTENWGDDGSEGTVTIETRVMSRMAELQQTTPVKTNLDSHDRMLARAGLSTGDTFFQNIPAINGKRIFWGTEGPDDAMDSGGGHDPGGTDGPGGPNKPPFLPR